MQKKMQNYCEKNAKKKFRGKKYAKISVAYLTYWYYEMHFNNFQLQTALCRHFSKKIFSVFLANLTFENPTSGSCMSSASENLWQPQSLSNAPDEIFARAKSNLTAFLADSACIAKDDTATTSKHCCQRKREERRAGVHRFRLIKANMNSGFPNKVCGSPIFAHIS